MVFKSFSNYSISTATGLPPIKTKIQSFKIRIVVNPTIILKIYVQMGSAMDKFLKKKTIIPAIKTPFAKHLPKHE